MIMSDGCDPICYKLTRPDTTTYMKNNVGCMCLILSESSDYNSKKDNIELKICDYITPTIPSTPPNSDENLDKTTVLCEIKFSKDFIKVGGAYTTFKGIITDVDGIITSDIGNFSINCDFADKLTTVMSANQIKLKISDDYQYLAGKTFELVFTAKEVTTLKTITIK